MSSWLQEIREHTASLTDTQRHPGHNYVEALRPQNDPADLQVIVWLQGTHRTFAQANVEKIVFGILQCYKPMKQRRYKQQEEEDKAR